MTGRLTLQDLRDAAAVGEIDTVIVAQVDMLGRLMGKRLHAPYFVEAAWAGGGACDYLLACDPLMTAIPGYGPASVSPGHGDHRLRPDLATLRRAAWAEGAALVLCDVLGADGAPVAHAPRSVLRAQLSRLAAMGLTAQAATELEFHLFRDAPEAARASGWRDLRPASPFILDYDIDQSAADEPVLRAIRRALDASDVAVEGTRGEGGAGQHELNLRHAEALVMADRHAVAKAAVKQIARDHGRAVTFMAKWADGQTGSSAHIHLSLTDAEGRSAFHDPGAPDGMAPLMRRFLAGMLAQAPALTVFLAPCVNSYKRLGPGGFAPARAGWSMDDRRSAFRVCGLGGAGLRIECRIGGADLNPHMALAALIAAGLDGVARGLDLPPPGEGAPALPRTLREAIEAASQSAALRAGFGNAVVEHWLHAARWEVAEADRAVTDWDRRRGFEQA